MANIKHVLEYEIGEIVYLKTDSDQSKHIITGIDLRPGLSVQYVLSKGAEEFTHYGIEISRERDIVLATSS